MTMRTIVSTVFALLCASSIEAPAALSNKYSDSVARAAHFAHQNFAGMRAAVPERPTIFPSARPQPSPYNYHETDGLSRNPNDCVVWGCIDGN
jgi:hypothetical protein